MTNTHNKLTAYPDGVTPINFCGKTVMWQLDCRIYEPPYETTPTTGEHDFNNCEACKNRMQDIEQRLSDKFNGKLEGMPAFPLCCEWHSGLVNLKEFNINDFRKVPEWTAKKIIYTHQHIKNHIGTEDYYKEITDYIDYTVDSFGQMPNASEPLYLNSCYLPQITHEIENAADIPKENKEPLLKYLQSFGATSNSAKSDLNILVGTYEKWFKIFPWQMIFFTQLKPQFEKELPIFKSVAPINKYSGKAIAKPYTKEELITILLNTTDSIVRQINSLTLYEAGLLTNTQKIKLDLIVNERRLKIQQGYTNTSPDEGQRYRKILKTWFADEKKFIDEITPLLHTPQPDDQSKPLTNLMPNECKYLYGKLTDRGHFLPTNTSKKCFNYIFGGGVRPDDFAPLCWNASKQALSELLLLLLNKKTVPTHIRQDVSRLFVKNHNKPIGNLSNPKKGEYSNDCSALETIVNDIKTRQQ